MKQWLVEKRRVLRPFLHAFKSYELNLNQNLLLSKLHVLLTIINMPFTIAIEMLVGFQLIIKRL